MRSVLESWQRLIAREGRVYRTGEPWEIAFWRTVLVDLKQGAYHGSTTAGGPTRLEERDIRSLSKLESEDILSELLRVWSDAYEPNFRQVRLIEQFNRRFFSTDGMYIGLGPPSLETGDSIFVLAGGTVAHALRELGGGKWKYIGEWLVFPRLLLALLTGLMLTLHSYVHGIMDGEFIRGANQGGDFSQTLRIV